VATAVDLGAPDDRRLVALGERRERPLRDDQVGLCIADQMLDDALGKRRRLRSIRRVSSDSFV
jgi:hypothetical protein